MPPRGCPPRAFFQDFLIWLIFVAPLILWLFATVTGKFQTMDAQEYHQWRDVPQIRCAIVGALMKQAFVYSGFWKEREPDLEDIIGSYYDDDMVAPQGTGTLPHHQTLSTIQPSEPRLQDTVSLFETSQEELVTDNSRAVSEITSTEVKSSATGNDVEAQQPITPRNVIQRLRNAHRKNTGNASESPVEVIGTFPPLAERKHTSVEVSRTTTSEDDGFAADVGTIGRTNSLPSSPEGYQANANLSGGKIDPERRFSFFNANPLVPDPALTLYQPTTSLIDDPVHVSVTEDPVNLSVGSAETLPGSTTSPDQGTTGGVGANLSGNGNDPERRVSEVDPLVPDIVDTDGHDTAQTPQQPSTVLPNDQVDSSGDNAGTNSGNTPSPANSSQAAIDGVVASRDASSGQSPLVSCLKWFYNRAVEGVNKRAQEDAEIIDRIIKKASRDYDLEYLKRGLTVDEFNQRIDKWKEVEHKVVRKEFPNVFREPLDYGEDWKVFLALQEWVRSSEHRRRNGEFPPGYRTLFNSDAAEIFSRGAKLTD